MTVTILTVTTVTPGADQEGGGMVESGILEAFVRVGGYGPTGWSVVLVYPTPQKPQIKALKLAHTSGSQEERRKQLTCSSSSPKERL